jgi:hypothetical protein
MDFFRVEIWQDGMRVASSQGANAAAVLQIAAQQAFIYGQDGPITLKIKNPNGAKKEQILPHPAPNPPAPASKQLKTKRKK